MKTLLVTGASGFLGWNLCRVARRSWRVAGLVNAHAIDIPETAVYPCDITDRAALKRAFETIRPAAVVHAAAASQPNWCQKHPEESERINVDASATVAGLCADFSIPCAFTSSDQVFDGAGGHYKENDPVSPVNRYGEQKAAAELRMREIWPRTAFCRMPLMFGDGGPAAKSFMQPWIDGLKAGKNLDLFVDEFRSMVCAATACRGILLALDKGVSGPLHLGGSDRVSRYDFGVMLARLLDIDPSLINPTHQCDVKMEAPRPADVSLDSSLAYSLGYNPGSLEEELRQVLKEMQL